MKTFFALVMLVGSLASARSIKTVDRWNCNFPYTDANSLIQGAIVNIDFDLVASKGNATQYANCPSCVVRPQAIPVERAYLTNLLVYKNLKSSFYVQILISQDYIARGTFPAVLGNKVSGTCTPR
ncbi:MAG: hypothetical protein JNL11_18010 [Bdellovibrionaceae bacterium]|nr:hypothetical protein [Pseudobdellovibrionaceae bacterium]